MTRPLTALSRFAAALGVLLGAFAWTLGALSSIAGDQPAGMDLGPVGERPGYTPEPAPEPAADGRARLRWPHLGWPRVPGWAVLVAWARRRRRLATVLAVLAVFGIGVGLYAFFTAGATAGSGGQALGGTLPTGNTPSASLSSGNGVVTWSQNSPTFLGGFLGANANGGYLITRYAVNASSTPITPASACNGLRQGSTSSLSCTESSLPPGRWKYAVTPKYYSWLGAESGQSASPVIVNPAAPTLVTFVTGGSYINSANVTTLSFDVTLPSTSLATDTVTLKLTDPGTANTVTATTSGTAGAGVAHFPTVNGSTLNQGTITISASVTNTYSDSSGSSPSIALTKDTVNPSNSLSLNLQSPAGSSFLSGATVFYRGTGGGSGGSFKIRNAVADGGSGPASSTTAALGGSTGGWSHSASTVSAPSGGPYDSNTFTWTEGTTSSPSEVVTGADSAGNTAAAGTLTFTNDSTGPTGGSVSYTNSYLTTTSVTVTLTDGSDGAGSGVNTSTEILQRASATLSNGSCGGFGSFSDLATDPALSYPDTTVASGNCYQYRYKVFDNVGNPTTFTSANVARIDTGLPTNALSLATSPAPVGAFLSGTTLFYKSDAVGSFKLVNLVTDPESGPASATFPVVSAAGWTHAAETVSSGTGSAPTINYTSSLYSWTANPNAPVAAARTFTSADVATNTSANTVLTFTTDTTAPTGGVLNVNGAGATSGTGSSSFNTSGSFPIGTRTDYNADTGSGFASSVLTVEVGTLSANACSGFGAPTPIVSNPSQSGLADGCYRYTLTGKDNVGNTTAITTTVKVDTVAPSTTDNTASIGNAWRKTSATVVLSPSDTGSGVATTYYTTNGTTPTTSSSTGTSILLSATGIYTIKYFSVDNAGNSEGVKPAGTQIRIDTVLPTNSLALATSPVPVGAFLSGTNLYFKSNAVGSFKLVNTVTDTDSGPASATFPLVSATNWIHAAETVSGGSGPYTSSMYSWTSGAVTPSGAQATFTSADVATNTSANTVLAFVPDTTATAPILTFPASAGFYNNTTWNAGCASAICGTAAADAGSGIQKIEVSVQQGAGNYWNGSTFGSASQVFNVATGTTSWSYAFAATNFPTEVSYTVSVRMTDNVGNVSTSTTATFTIDRTTPTVSTLQLKNNGVAGKIEKGDQIILTFSEQMSVSSLCSTWSGDGSDQSLAANNDVTVSVNDGGVGNDTISVTSGTCTFNLGSINLGSTAYNTSGSAITFSGSGVNKSTITWTASTRTLTITLGAGTTTPSTAVTSSMEIGRAHV